MRKRLYVSGIGKRKYTRAQLTAYKTIVNGYEEKEKKEYDIEYFKYYILLDLLNIAGFDKNKLSQNKLKVIKTLYYNDFKTVDKN